MGEGAARARGSRRPPRSPRSTRRLPPHDRAPNTLSPPKALVPSRAPSPDFRSPARPEPSRCGQQCSAPSCSPGENPEGRPAAPDLGVRKHPTLHACAAPSHRGSAGLLLHLDEEGAPGEAHRTPQRGLHAPRPARSAAPGAAINMQRSDGRRSRLPLDQGDTDVRAQPPQPLLPARPRRAERGALDAPSTPLSPCYERVSGRRGRAYPGLRFPRPYTALARSVTGVDGDDLLRGEGAVHRALVGDLQELRALLLARLPSSSTLSSIASILPPSVSHAAQSSAWILACLRRAVTPPRGMPFLRACIVTVIAVHAPREASSRS